MSGELPAVVKVLDRSSTTGTARLVLIAIASYAAPDGCGAWPSHRRIADRAGLTAKHAERNVRRHIARLIDKGELHVHFKGGPRGSTNLYEVICARDPDIQMPGSDLGRAVPGSTALDLDTQVPGSSGSRDAPEFPPGHLALPTRTSDTEHPDGSGTSPGHLGVQGTGRTGTPEQDQEQDARSGKEKENDDLPVEEIEQRLRGYMPMRPKAEEAIAKAFADFPEADPAEALATAIANRERADGERADGVILLRTCLHYHRLLAEGESGIRAWQRAEAAEVPGKGGSAAVDARSARRDCPPA